jgi:hypothetical protein
MKFTIIKTSELVYGEKRHCEKQPCEEAYLAKEKDDFGYKVYKIEIKSLKELIELCKKYGDIIVDGDKMILEIYDEYRE